MARSKYLRLTGILRPDLDTLITSLTELGATHVFTYDALSDKQLAKHIIQWTSGSVSVMCTLPPDYLTSRP